MTDTAGPPTRRLELILQKPWFGWFPKPTVVVDGRGNPAQWGSGTWMIPARGATIIGVYLFNRVWHFGAAEIELDGLEPSSIRYSAPWLPFVKGRFRD